LKYHVGKTDKLVLSLDLVSVGGLCLCVLVEVVLFLFGRSNLGRIVLYRSGVIFLLGWVGSMMACIYEVLLVWWVDKVLGYV